MKRLLYFLPCLVLAFVALALPASAGLSGETGTDRGELPPDKRTEGGEIGSECHYRDRQTGVATANGIYGLFDHRKQDWVWIDIRGEKVYRKDYSASQWRQKVKEAATQYNTPYCSTIIDPDTRHPIDPELLTSGSIGTADGKYCTIGYQVFRFYGTRSNPVQVANRSRVNVNTPCEHEMLVSHIPHPKDGGGSLSLPSTIKGYNVIAPGTIHAGNTCPTGFHDPAGLAKYFQDTVEGYTGYRGKPIEDPSKRKPGYDYDFHMTAISVRRSMWNIFQKTKDSFDPYQRPAIFNTSPARNKYGVKTFKYWVVDDKGNRVQEETIAYGEETSAGKGIPCSSPFDFISPEGTKPSNYRTYGMCWVGIGRHFLTIEVKDTKGRVLEARQAVAEPFYYTNRQWVDPGGPATWNGATPGQLYEKNIAPKIVSKIESFLEAAQLPGSMNQGGRIRTQRIANKGVFTVGSPMSFSDFGKTANCYKGEGSAVTIDEVISKVQIPELKIGRTWLSENPDRAYVAGTDQDWVIQINRGEISVDCVSNCNRFWIDRSTEQTTWKNTLTVPSSWKLCNTNNRTTCAYSHKTSHSGGKNPKSYTHTLNFYKATRPNEKVGLISASPGSVSAYVCTQQTNTFTFKVDILWSSTIPGWSNGRIGSLTGSGGTPTSVCEKRTISIPGVSTKMTVGGPYLTP